MKVNASLDIFGVLKGDFTLGHVLTVDSTSPVGLSFRPIDWVAPNSNLVDVNADLDVYGILKGSFTSGHALTVTNNLIGLSFAAYTLE